MTTDTDALEERIAAEIYYSVYPEGRHRNEWPNSVHPMTVYEYRDLAAPALPIVAEEVRKAKAGAWDEGYMEATSGDGDPFANPYRYETGDSDEHR